MAKAKNLTPRFSIPDYLNQHAVDHIVYISLRHKYVYFSIPKVASTYILELLHTLETRHTVYPHPAYKGNWTHKYAMPATGTHDRAASPLFMPSLLPDDIVHEALFGNSFFRFAFVRDPVQRGISAYYDKIWNSTAIRREFCSLVNLEDPGDVGFLSEEDYVALLPKIPRPVLDLHLRPQVEILMARSGIKLDFVGSINKLDDGLGEVFRRLEVNFRPIPQDAWMREHSTVEIQKARKFSDAALVRLKDFLGEDISFYEKLEIYND